MFTNKWLEESDFSQNKKEETSHPTEALEGKKERKIKMNIVLKKRMEYILYEDKGKYLLSVVCGTVGMFEINIYLNQEEMKQFEKNGEVFIKILAERIRCSPKSFVDRSF